MPDQFNFYFQAADRFFFQEINPSSNLIISSIFLLIQIL